MRLVDHRVRPTDATQLRGVSEHRLVRGEHESGIRDARGGGEGAASGRSLRGGAGVLEHIERRAEGAQLLLPPREGRERGDDEVGAAHAASVQQGEEGDGLRRLAEAHLVGEDPREAALICRDEISNAAT